jgi:hypothetical protein
MGIPVERGAIAMTTRELKTIRSEPGQAWEMVWKELRRVGITKGDIGPCDGIVNWGENAAIAIERLQESKLPASDVNNIGLLIQATVRGAAILWRPSERTG